MTHIRSRFLLAATVASVAFSSVAQAQGAPQRARDAQRDQQGPAGMMRRGGAQPDGEMPFGRQRGGRRNPASMLLRLRSELQLTDDQVKRLEALQEAPAPTTNEADVLRARADLLEATRGDANLSKARAALDRMSALRNERMIAGLKQRQDARAVLTASQKTRLDNMRTELRGRGGARGGRGGRGQGMGRGNIGRGAPQGMRGQFGPGAGQGPRGGMRGIRGGMGPGAPIPPAPRPPEGELPPA